MKKTIACLLIFAAQAFFGLITVSAVYAADNLSAFYNLKSSDPAAAKKALSAYLAENPNDANAQMEMAYALLNEKNYKDAIPYLEKARALRPNDEKISLQLAYAYKAAGQNSKARAESARVSKSSSSAVASAACQTVIDLAPRRFAFLPPPFFADAYVNPVYLSRFNDTIWFMQGRAGVAFGDAVQTEVYGSVRYVDDNKSIGGAVPDIISDNVAIFAGGVRLYPTRKIPISIYGEAGEARDLNDRNRDRWRDDYRAGLVYFDRWTPPARCDLSWRFPFRRSSSLYADVSVYSRYDRDWIGYVQWREGLRVLEFGRMATDAFIYLGGAADSNNVYYNNIAEIGGGATLVPDQSWPVFFRYTAVKGSYVDVGSPIPTKKDYTDHRWEAVGYVRF